jgi:hypothetical protein
MPVARLKNMQRQQGLRKKRDVGQRHHRHFIGHYNFRFHGKTLSKIGENSTVTILCHGRGTVWGKVRQFDLNLTARRRYIGVQVSF